MGRSLIYAGLVLIVVGVLLTYGKRLPGDFVYRGKNFTFYFPLATSLVLSLVLSLVFWLFSRK